MRRIEDVLDRMEGAEPKTVPGIFDLGAWGANDLAYVKPVEGENNRSFAVFTGDGHLIAIVETHLKALEYIASLDAEVAGLH